MSARAAARAKLRTRHRAAKLRTQHRANMAPAMCEYVIGRILDVHHTGSWLGRLDLEPWILDLGSWTLNLGLDRGAWILTSMDRGLDLGLDLGFWVLDYRTLDLAWI